MKNVKLNLLNRLLIITIITFATTIVAPAQTQEVTIMTTAQCGECKENIEKALLDERGVKFAELDVKSKKVKVIYNSKKTDIDKLRKTISLTGYDADDVPADAEAVKRLDPCCTKDGHRED